MTDNIKTNKLETKEISLLDKIIKISIIIMYLSLSVTIIVFVYNYGFIDWEQVSNEMDSTIENMIKVIQCEYQSEDFTFKGNCKDLEAILKLNMTRMG